MTPMQRPSAPSATGRPAGYRKHVAALLLPLLLAAACDTGPAESLYDPDSRSPLADPVITSVTPAGAAFAGVDVITISGQNFSSDAARNLVYFQADTGDIVETGRATIVSASPTELRVISPPTPAPSVDIRVAVLGVETGAENFSNTFVYRLDAAFEKFGGIGKIEDPTAIATDASGTIYMAYFSGGVSAGFQTISPEGVRSDFTGSTFLWRSVAVGPDGLLYAVRNIRAIFRFAEGGAQEVFLALTPTTLRIAAITFDADGNLWAGGNNTEILKVAPDKSVSRYALEADVTALKVYDGALYAVAENADGFAVWRFPIDGNGDLGTGQKYFDIAGQLGEDVRSEALAFATDGTMYLGTDRADPVEMVMPSGSHETLYPGVLVQPVVGGSQVPPAPVLDLAWGPDPYLYMIQERPAGTIGEDARLMTRVNTRNSGAR